MQRLVIGMAIVVLSGCLMAQTSTCAQPPPVRLYSDTPFDLQIFFDDKPAVEAKLWLYRGGKLAHAAIADRGGRIWLGLLPAGEYKVVLPRGETLNLLFLSRKSGLNVPLISWYLFPRSKYKWVAGKRVAGRQCPFWGLKDD